MLSAELSTVGGQDEHYDDVNNDRDRSLLPKALRKFTSPYFKVSYLQNFLILQSTGICCTK